VCYRVRDGRAMEHGGQETAITYLGVVLDVGELRFKGRIATNRSRVA
jgi:hypothetical protein